MIEVPVALTLFFFTLLLLFLPKLVSVVLTLGNPEAVGRFGGRLRLVLSAVLETAASVLLAPVNMMFNAKFVLLRCWGRGWAGLPNNAERTMTAPTGVRQSSRMGDRRRLG